MSYLFGVAPKRGWAVIAWALLCHGVHTDVLINEILYHPLSGDPAEEYIEIHNTGEAAIQLKGWRVASSVDYEFGDAALPPGGYLVVVADLEVFGQGPAEPRAYVGPWEGRLNNRGERIRLLDQTGRLVDEVDYADQGAWSRRVPGLDDRGHVGWVWDDAHDGGGMSLELRNPYLPNQWGHNWAASLVPGGTPGLENSVLSRDIEPLIVEVKQAPTIPRSSDLVQITVRVIDKNQHSVSSVLRWRIDGAARFETSLMRPIGSRASGRFVAEIPALPDKTVVEYYVSAIDSAGNPRVTPQWIGSQTGH